MNFRVRLQDGIVVAEKGLPLPHPDTIQVSLLCDRLVLRAPDGRETIYSWEPTNDGTQTLHTYQAATPP